MRYYFQNLYVILILLICIIFYNTESLYSIHSNLRRNVCSNIKLFLKEVFRHTDDTFSPTIFLIMKLPVVQHMNEIRLIHTIIYSISHLFYFYCLQHNNTHNTKLNQNETNQQTSLDLLTNIHDSNLWLKTKINYYYYCFTVCRYQENILSHGTEFIIRTVPLKTNLGDRMFGECRWDLTQW